MLLLITTALAQDAALADPPFPIQGDRWAAQVSAYALPPQKVEYLTDAAELRSCSVWVTLTPDASASFAGGECPAPMLQDAVAASQQWSFEPLGAPQGAARFELRYVLLYSAALSVTTLHAEVDPGAEASRQGEQGPPGVKLVRAPELKKPIKAKLPKAARAAGLEGTVCEMTAVVGVGGAAAKVVPKACPEPLVQDALKRVSKSRWWSGTVDGLPQEQGVKVMIEY